MLNLLGKKNINEMVKNYVTTKNVNLNNEEQMDKFTKFVKKTCKSKKPTFMVIDLRGVNPLAKSNIA